MEPTSSSAVARQTWELENNIPAFASDPDAMDAMYRYDEATNARAHQEKPSATDQHHFHRARISALALLKMVVHARASGTIEIMGLMQGR
ncbi:COP9 signalosome complex subunit 5-like [Hordeum vulgare subsp. vulgare]|uniref:COP9 signalosome complex subunit 5-like n=1 Tax=Hordeum vulgare subsp. vulgare TaxID=112509 RepID=UPI001D1A571C|nr:COP9 signalosome complex subunit 5-like [Hordeum vulgare subsp. vulgare]